MLWWLSLYHFSSDLIHELQTSASCCLLLFPHGYLKGISDLTCRKQNSRRRRWHPTQYYCLENPMDGGAWWAAVHGVTKSRTRLSDFTFTFHFHALEKEMATHSSILAWENPRDGGAWWAAVYGVAQSQTRLKWLNSSSSKQNSCWFFFLFSHPNPFLSWLSVWMNGTPTTLHLSHQLNPSEYIQPLTTSIALDIGVAPLWSPASLMQQPE